MEEHGVQEARDKLGELVDRVRYGGETFLITRNGKPAAVLVNVDELAELREQVARLSERRAER